MAAVTDAEARALIDEAARWKLDVLVEVHNQAELDRALALGAMMIGINNRDLRTFITDILVTIELAPKIPADILVVAESGLSDADDLQRLAEVGVTTVLVGESLMRKSDVALATRDLLSAKFPA